MPLTMSPRHRSINRSKGFTLIEVMVAALVLAIGILGLASSMLAGLKSDKSAYYRSQAAAIATDMAERMRANRDNIANYEDFTTERDIVGANNCLKATNGCTGVQLVSQDFREMQSHFVNVNELSNFSPKLPNGVGTIGTDDDGRYVITVSWSEDDWDGDDLSNRVDTEKSVTLTLDF